MVMADRIQEVEANDAALSFWSIFEHSRIPMALLDRERRYVRVNDALVNFWEYPRSQLEGRPADSMVVDERNGIPGRWEQLVHSGQLYGRRIIEHACGTQFQVTYGAHVITVGGDWHVLVVTLSARLPDGAELIGSSQVKSAGAHGSMLTPRERQVVRLVALGANTRRIATELSLSPETVRSHVRNAMSRMGAHTRAHLVALVLSDGPVTDPPAPGVSPPLPTFTAPASHRAG
jgi:DNA-binding CsgD family transcriptional regulator